MKLLGLRPDVPRNLRLSEAPRQSYKLLEVDEAVLEEIQAVG